MRKKTEVEEEDNLIKVQFILSHQVFGLSQYLSKENADIPTVLVTLVDAFSCRQGPNPNMPSYHALVPDLFVVNTRPTQSCVFCMSFLKIVQADPVLRFGSASLPALREIGLGPGVSSLRCS